MSKLVHKITYISKPDEWFDAGTIATLIDDYRTEGLNSGLFSGLRNGELDEEICPFDEFDIVDELLEEADEHNETR